MALAVLDGNQSATTLSSVVTGGEHIVAHSVVSLGSNAISNIATAVSGSTVCVGNLGLLQSTVATEGLTASGAFIKIGGHTGTSTTGNIAHVSAIGALRVDGSSFTQPVSISSVTIGNTVTISGTVTANPTGTQTIAGTVTANVPLSVDGYTATTGIRVIGTGVDGTLRIQGIDPNTGSSPANLEEGGKIPVFGTVTANVFGEDKVSGGFLPIPLTDSGEAVSVNILTAFGSGINVPISGTVTANPTGTQTIAGSVTLGASTAQIGSVTASISNSVTIASLPAISGTVTANLAISSSAITSGSFTSLTSATLVPANTARKMATVYNLGAGRLFINAGATATTLGGGFMVALNSGDFYECDYTTTTLSAIFATAGTASWMSH